MWADGPLTVEEAAITLKISEAKVARLVRDGKLVSMKDGRRLIAKRGCIRYLLRHQEHQDNADDVESLEAAPLREKPAPKGKPKK